MSNSAKVPAVSTNSNGVTVVDSRILLQQANVAKAIQILSEKAGAAATKK